MIKPDQYDMEPGTFHNSNELFVSYMISIDRKWGLILTTLQREDAAFKKEDISCIQDDLKMPLEFFFFLKKKKVANHALYVNLLGSQKQSKRSSYFELDRAFIRDAQANLPEGQERHQDEYPAEEGGSAQAQKGRHGE